MIQWIQEHRFLGAVGLDPAQNFHAKTVLVMWNKTPPNVDIFQGYPTDSDLLFTGWSARDARMLGSFVLWWNNPANPPRANWSRESLPEPTSSSGATGFQQSDLTDVHIEALNTWALRSGAGLPSCIENCLANAIGSISIANATPQQVSNCMSQCAGTVTTPPVQVPPVTITPPVTTPPVTTTPPSATCPITFEMGERFAAAKGYKIYYFDQALVAWISRPPKPEYASNPNARAFSTAECAFYRWNGSQWVTDDQTNNEFLIWVNQPLPGAPPPTTTPTKAASTGNATAVLAGLALLGVVGLIVNSALTASRTSS